MNLSFAGCGFLGIYHVGVATCFKKYAPHLLLDKVSGASAGAIAACCLLVDLPIEEMMRNLMRLAKEARQRTLGPLSPSFNVHEILLESLQKILPEDAHIRVSGKLHISLTRVYDGRNVIVSQFDSREDLFQALLASSFIPFFCGFFPPRFHGIRYMDGGFSDNLPTLDENTITVSPFCGESDICPRDFSPQLFHVNVANTSIELSRENMYRFARVLFPPNPEMLSKMCQQGFDDALRFLNRNNLINCNRCIAVQSTFVVAETIEQNTLEYDLECSECKAHRQEASVASLPETVLTILEDAINSANQGVINWLFKHKSVRLLSLLSLPYILPADVAYATFTKADVKYICKYDGCVVVSCLGNKSNHKTFFFFYQNVFTGADFSVQFRGIIINAPKLQKGLIEKSRYFLEQLSLVFPKISVNCQPIKHYQCHLDIMEYETNIYDVESIENNTYKQNQTDLDFLEYSDVKPRSDCKHSPNCVINISDLEAKTDDSFNNILEVTMEGENYIEYGYAESSNHNIMKIFDVTSEKSQHQKIMRLDMEEDFMTSLKVDN